jgi:uncharacterized repeat protein (TIGR02543 family)/LPXTG-motif cell wall-anchored protein
MKKAIACLLCLVLTLTLLPAAALAAEDGYVSVSLTVNDAFAQNGRDASLRIAAAQEKFDTTQFSTLAQAAQAVKALYNAEGAGDFSLVKGTNGATMTYTNCGPFYYRASDTPTSSEREPITAVTYTIHGVVQSGSANSIDLTPSRYYTLTDVCVVGADQTAAISQCAGLYAEVAGGYDSIFASEGTLTVDGIRFFEGGAHTSISAGGAGFETKNAEACNLVIQNCTFDNMLYVYVNDPDTEMQNMTVSHCSFTASGTAGNYAIFIQPDQVSADQGGVLTICDNTIENYRRGINVQTRPQTDVSITGNTIRNLTEESGSAIQITTDRNYTISNNTISGIPGNVFRVHELAANVASVSIGNNTITDSGYMIFVDKDVLSPEKIVFSGNTIANVDIAHGYDKDLPEGQRAVAHTIDPNAFGDLFRMTVVYLNADGTQIGTQVLTYGDVLTRPQDPVRSGYTFTGWYTDAACTNAWNFDNTVTSNLSLYAGWMQAVPKTGDSTAILLYALILLTAFGAAAFVFVSKKRAAN